MTILSKECKPNNFESHNSLKLSFTNVCGLHSNFVECESFLKSNSPDILALCERNADDCEGLSSFNPKRFYYSYTWSCNLCERRTCFARDLSLKNSDDSYLCFRMTLLHLSHLLPRYERFFILFHLI